MKKICLAGVLTLLFCAPLFARASTNQRDQDLQRAILQSRSWDALSKADITEIKKDDLERVVHIGKSNYYAILGVASAEKLNEFLKPYGYKPLKVFGKVPVAIGLSVNDDFVGCGCPKAFNEISLTYSIKSRANGSWYQQVVPIWSLATHPQRRASMATKFGTLVELGEAGLSDKNAILVKDQEGNTILEARPAKGFPESTHSGKINFGIHSIGGQYQADGETEVRSLHEMFYRIAGKSKNGYRRFSSSDTYTVNPESTLGKILASVEFKPLFWETMELHNATAWIPVDQHDLKK